MAPPSIAQPKKSSNMLALYDQDMLRAMLCICTLVALVAGFFALHFGHKNTRLTAQVATLTRERNDALQQRCLVCPVCQSCLGLAQQHNKPPIISLAETRGQFRFSSGSADLSSTFRTALIQEIVPQILAAKSQYGVNTIQIVGHTDEVSVGNRRSTVDHALISFLTDGLTVVSPGSNMDLGAMRAGSVRQFLSQDSRLRGFRILPYSAGQAIMPDNTVASGFDKGHNPARRRIEMYLTVQ